MLGTLEDAYNLYKEGHSLVQISKTMKVNRTRITNLLKEHYGIVPNLCNRKSIDDSYFSDINTPDAAYWLGFLMGDGYINTSRGDLELGLKIEDLPHLLKFTNSLKSDHKVSIKEVKLKGKVYQACRVSIKNKKLVGDLSSLGCDSTKTYTSTIPKLPQNLISHFIRGLLDADGSLNMYLRPSGTRACVISLTTASPIMVYKYSKVLMEFLNISTNIYVKKGTTCYDVTISANRDSYKLLNWIYANSTDDIRLERKYNVYKHMIAELDRNI